MLYRFQYTYTLYICLFLGGCITIIHDDIAILAQLATEPYLQGRGIGSFVMNKVLTALGERNIAVDSTMKAVPLYQRHGFKLSELTMMTVVGVPKIPNNYTHPDHISIEWISQDNIEKVLDYEDTLFYTRREFSRAFWSHS